MKIYIGDGLLHKLKSALPNGIDPWRVGIPIYSHIAFPYFNDDGDTVVGCIFTDKKRILLVEKALPFTTA